MGRGRTMTRRRRMTRRGRCQRDVGPPRVEHAAPRPRRGGGGGGRAMGRLGEDRGVGRGEAGGEE
eukprot:3987954-Pyramimonas_sp.AAC.1